MSETGVTLEAIEARLVKCEQIQNINVPKFNALIRRVGRIEKDVSTSTVAVAEIKRLMAVDNSVRVANAEKLDNILAIVGSAKAAGGFVRKYGPHAATFGVGALVMAGKISAETGKSFLHLFGL